MSANGRHEEQVRIVLRLLVPYLNPMGSKGIGEIGIVGTAAAVTNAVHHATGVRFRRLPIRLDQVVRAQ
ncbi:MAG TPA: hypothetical protein VFI04_03525 [Gaiellaceae bacterium]|nr:hypothetical protein [Gaiellaceae bacterium]